MTSHDPDFEPLARNQQGSRVGAYCPDPEEDLRLVANPFLTMLLVLGALAVIAKLCKWLGAWVFLGLLPIGLGIPWTLQYHCLDCGSTGLLLHWKQHLCLETRKRRELGLRRRFRGPNPVLQVCLWFYALLGLLVMIHAWGWL